MQALCRATCLSGSDQQYGFQLNRATDVLTISTFSAMHLQLAGDYTGDSIGVAELLNGDLLLIVSSAVAINAARGVITASRGGAAFSLAGEVGSALTGASPWIVASALPSAMAEPNRPAGAAMGRMVPAIGFEMHGAQVPPHLV